MSHQVVIDYQGLSITLQSQCDVASHSLCKITKILDKIHETSKTLINQTIKEYEQNLLVTKEKLLKEIHSFQNELEEYKKIRNSSDTSLKQSIEARAHLLSQRAAELTGYRLDVIERMIDENLLNAGKESAEDIFNQIHGVNNFNEKIMGKINEIEDIALREMVYKAYLSNQNLKYDQILEIGKKSYQEVLNEAKTSIVLGYKEELIGAGINEEMVNNVVSGDVTTMAESVNKALVDEKVRKETLKIIIKAIRDRGFLVDTKKNIKIDREKNVVRLVAVKVDGKKVEFEISLNGKFMYHFGGYEGQACQKDITPFMDDLEKIYGINILHEEVIWSNPDKIQTQKYQYIDSNKGKK